MVALNQQAIIYFYLEIGMRIMKYGQDFSYIEDPYQQLNRVKSVSDSMSYILLRGSWCSVIVLDVHAPRDYGADDAKGSFY
jgi:hypothetical protein